MMTYSTFVRLATYMPALECDRQMSYGDISYLPLIFTITHMSRLTRQKFHIHVVKPLIYIHYCSI